VLAIILRRAVFLTAVIVAITAITFVLLHNTGVDPAQLLAGPQGTPQQIAALRQRFGLAQPPVIQYFYYLKELTRGDFGVSIHTQHAVGADLTQFLPATIELVFAAIVFAVVVGLTLGTLAGVYRGSWIDTTARLLSLSGLAVPVFRMRQDSERKPLLARISPLLSGFDRCYAACSSAHTSPHHSTKRRRWSARGTVSFRCWR